MSDAKTPERKAGDRFITPDGDNTFVIRVYREYIVNRTGRRGLIHEPYVGGLTREDAEFLAHGRERVAALEALTQRVRMAWDHMEKVKARGHSEFIRENGRFGSSPWAEFVETLTDLLDKSAALARPDAGKGGGAGRDG